MADPRFFRRRGPFRLAELAAVAGAKLAPGGDPERGIVDVASLEAAGPEDVTFLDNRRYLRHLSNSRAGACLLQPQLAERAPSGMALLLSEQPYRAYALIAHHFYPPVPANPGRHPTAVIHPTAKVPASAEIGPYVVIEAQVEIGERTRLKAQSYIGEAVILGEDCEIGPQSSLQYCIIGHRCQVHPGARIGNRGFGFTADAAGFIEIPQVGRVMIGNDVEIGANTTIDRGASGDTIIGDGTRIDNLVQVAHNVQLGRQCILVAQSGIAGSTRLADNVSLAAQSGIAGHLTLDKGAKVAAKSGVMRDVRAGETVGGLPAIPLRDYFRLVTLWQRQLQGKADRNE
jgi:UDP-3-O-[3-hydroxymyristoyl] glucosamine N-acyltransferase